MFNNRRFYIIITFIVVLASVFFVSSCGEPTFISLPNVNDAISKEESTTGTAIQFSISLSDPDLSIITNGPGLILSYIIFDNNDTSDTDIVNPPANDFDTGSYFNIRSDYNTLVSHGTLLIGSDQSLTQTRISKNGKTYTIKSFNVGSSGRASAPTYHLNLNKSSSFSEKFTLELKDVQISNCSFILRGESSVSEYSLSETFGTSDRISVVIFAGITSGLGNYNSAPIFSTLTYIGTINVNFNE